jgi:hypothetical protein
MIPGITKAVHFKVAITEIYPQIPWELVEDNMGSAEHPVGTTGPADRIFCFRERSCSVELGNFSS